MRAREFSPNAVAKDEAIMMAVVERLRALGRTVDVVNEREPWTLSFDCDLIITMGRLPETIRRLQDISVNVINRPEGVAHCCRKSLQQLMRAYDIPMPPEKGDCGYWLKRGDVAGSMSDDDVVFVADADELKARVDVFRQRGVDDYTVSAHVKGEEMKFYGVLHTGFFRSYSLTDQQATLVPGLCEVAERLAAVVGVEVYGGDCIVRQDGTFCIIDFNDWPSFSWCREEAASAIVSAIAMQLLNDK